VAHKGKGRVGRISRRGRWEEKMKGVILGLIFQ